MPCLATGAPGDHAADNVVEAHDRHSTMRHLPGIDHEQLTCRYHGRDFRIPHGRGRVFRGLLT